VEGKFLELLRLAEGGVRRAKAFWGRLRSTNPSCRAGLLPLALLQTLIHPSS
jgi:hypothetical protein